MNQVFVSNHMAGIQANADHSLWSSLVHTTGAADGHAACMVGIWDPYGQRYLDGTTAALGLISPLNVAAITANEGTDATNETIIFGTSQQGTIIKDGTNIAAGQEVVNVQPSSPSFLNRAFQIVQAMPTGNAIASPIIHTSQLTRLKWDVNDPPTKHKLEIATDTGFDPIIATDEITLVLNVRFPHDAAYYEAQINPTGSVTSVTPALSAAFDNTKRIYKVNAIATSATEADQAAVIVAAINADGDVKQLVTATDAGGGVQLEANFFGMIIDATILKNGDKAGAVTDSVDMTPGVGSFAEVLSAEKKAQYSQGFMNRLYLPTGDLQHASATAGGLSSQTVLYNRLTLEYENKAGKMPGFNGQGNTHTATLYVPKATYAAQATQLAVEATFGLVDATASKEFIW